MRALAVLPAVVAALVASIASAAVDAPGVVMAGGSVTVYHQLCDSIGSGDIRIALQPTTTSKPADRWAVQIQAQSETGCEAHALGACDGLGALAEGVKLSGCTPAVSGGTFGPVYVCIPGPIRPGMLATHGSAAITIDGVMGTFDGTVPALVAGSIADEAVNICL